MLDTTKVLLEDYNAEFKGYLSFVEGNDWGDDIEVNKNGDFESEKLNTEVSIIKTVISGTNRFIEDVEDDFNLKPVQDLLSLAGDIIKKHIEKLQEFKKAHPLTESSTQADVQFHADVFDHIVKAKAGLVKLDLGDKSKSPEIFYGNAKAPLLMRESLTALIPSVKDRVDGLGINFGAPIINPATHNEMFINMKDGDIPKWDANKHFYDQEKSTIEFWEEELRKCKDGVNVGGYHISGWLYWHLNHFKLAFGSGYNKKVSNPHFRDNEYYFDQMIRRAKEHGRKGVFQYGTRRFAKALRNSEKLYRSNGEIFNIGDVKVGDSIIGGDGKPTKVLGVYPQGKIKLYRVTLGDGRQIDCCDDHLWTVFDSQSRREKVLPLKEIRKHYKYTRHYTDRRNNEVYNYYIPLNKEICYDDHLEPFIDPYFLGTWLGDGNSRSVSLTSVDDYIIDYWKSFAEKNNLSFKHAGKYHYRISTKKGSNNSILNLLSGKNLIQNKHIPEECFRWSPEDKMSLLQGLMDTDGCAQKTGQIDFVSASRVLFDGVVRLCRELGIGCYPRYDKTGGYVKKSGEFNNYHKVSLFTDREVFRLERKLERIDKNARRNNKSRFYQTPIVNIEECGEDYATCIRVDNEDKLFVTTNCIVTHNSVNNASYVNHALYTIPNCKGSILGFSDKPDLEAMVDYTNEFITNVEPAFKLPMNSIDFTNGIQIGLKGKKAQLRYDHAKLLMLNLDGGTNKLGTQKGAGSTPDVFVIVEAGKGPVIPIWNAARPSFADNESIRWRCVPLLDGTAGEGELSKDAETMLKDPDTYDILPMDWDLLDSMVPDPEYITWRREKFGMFVPAQMSLEGPPKLNSNFAEFLKLPKSHPLSQIQMKVTDWAANNEFYKEQRDLKKNDISTLASYTNSYPLQVEDCYMSTQENIFPGLECKNRINLIKEEGLTGQTYRLINSNGAIRSEMVSEPLITDYPFKGGVFDAPLVMVENPLLDGMEPPLGLYTMGVDDIKFSGGSKDSDSVFSATVFKRSYEGGEWGNRFVAWYDTRPNNKKTAYEQAYLMMKIFNARVLYENNDSGFLEYVEDNHPEDVYKHFSQGIGIASESNLNYNSSRKFGWMATAQNIYRLTQSLVRYAKSENNVVGDKQNLSGVDLINHPMLLEEMYRYKPKQNADRLRSAGLALILAEYYDRTYAYMKRRSISEEAKKKRQDKLKKFETYNGLSDVSDLTIW